MFAKRFFSLLTALVCLLGATMAAYAAETDCDTVYCFTQEDFSQEDAALAGICITDLPESDLGTVMLGSRVLQPGDILTADQVAQMTFCPLLTEEDVTASVSYLPIYEDHVAPSATMTLSIRGKEDKAPVAEDSAAETYKNLPNTGKLKVEDPEGQALTFTVTRQPKRGDVTINADGSFTYTPKKNKVGVDSFTYTATDPAGHVSREATVTVTILKPTDATQYTDTVGKSCRFAAEWMKNTGIFIGENVSGNACFSPEKEVTKGEFVTMLVKALEIPTQEDATFTGYTDDVPQWLQPYLAAAIRSGLTDGLPSSETFGAYEPITGAEAAVMLQNALDLAVSIREDSVSDEAEAAEPVSAEEENVESVSDGAETAIPAWAETSLAVMNENGIILAADCPLTRAEVAQMLYQAVQLSDAAPGMAVIRAQQ